MYSGLVGPLVVCRAGILDASGTPTDVQREVCVRVCRYCLLLDNLVAHFLLVHVRGS